MRLLKNFSIILLYFIIFITIINFLPKTINFLNTKFYKNSEKTILDFKFITPLNKDFKINDLKKKPSIFFFGFTNCPDVCPLTLYKISQSINQLKVENKIKVFFVTLDPERDGPNELNKYLKFYKLDITGLTGKIENINKLSKFMNIKFVKRKVDDDYTIDHTASVILLDKKLNIVDKIYYDEDLKKSSEKIMNLIKASL